MMGFVRKLSLRIRQYNWQEGLCCWCLEPMEFTLPCHARGSNELAATWEHVVPRTLGGTSARKNTLLAHRRCNLERGHKVDRTPHFTPYPPQGKGDGQ
jgi:5-methylcytosine-specific restriction endonuclease McrA